MLCWWCQAAAKPPANWIMPTTTGRARSFLQESPHGSRPHFHPELPRSGLCSTTAPIAPQGTGVARRARRPPDGFAAAPRSVRRTAHMRRRAYGNRRSRPDDVNPGTDDDDLMRTNETKRGRRWL